MNKVIKHAKGKYIGIVNSDDWYNKDTLEIISSFCDKDYGLIYGLLKYCDDSMYQCI